MGAYKSCSTGNNDSQGIKPPGQVFFTKMGELNPAIRIPYSLLDTILASRRVYGPRPLRPLLYVRVFAARILTHQRFGAMMVTKRALPAPLQTTEQQAFGLKVITFMPQNPSRGMPRYARCARCVSSIAETSATKDRSAMEAAQIAGAGAGTASWLPECL